MVVGLSISSGESANVSVFRDDHLELFYFVNKLLARCDVSFQAAFLLPVITRLLNEKVDGASRNDSQSPEVLIISPTRELTLQIYNEARKFVHKTIYRPVVCYGGTSVGHQLRQLESGCNILVGTPGRLLDFLSRKKVTHTHTHLHPTEITHSSHCL